MAPNMPASSLSRELKSERYQQDEIDLENKNSSHSLTVELVGWNKRVLEIGTSTGYITQVLKGRGNRVIGVEIDKEAGETARQYCESMIIGDVDELDMDAFLKPASIDVILMGDVLEHLRWPGRILGRIKKYLKPDGYLVVSLPNVAHGDLLLNLLNGDFRYTSMGLLDETHLRFFGKKNIINIFNKFGYIIKDLHETKIPVGSTELRIDFGKIPPMLLKLISSLPDSDVYQFVFKAIPSDDSFNEAIPNVDFNAVVSVSLEDIIKLHESQVASIIDQLQQANNKAAVNSQEAMELKGVIAGRDEQIASITDQLQQANTQAAVSSQEAMELKGVIASRDEQIASITDQLQQANTQAAVSSQEAMELKGVIAGRDEQIASISEQLIQIKAREASLNQNMGELQSTLIERDGRISSLSEQLERSNAHILTLNGQLGELNARNRNLEIEVAEMNRSIIWRITLGFHNNFVEKIFPLGTRRRKDYDIGLKAARILVDEGTSSLLDQDKRRKAYHKAISYNESETPQKSLSDNSFADQICSFYQSERKQADVKRHYKKSTTIIICVHNALTDAKACLESLIKYTPQIYSTILVDDGSDFETASFLKAIAREHNYRLIRNDAARGYTFAANQGLKCSKSEYAVLLNSDIIVTPDWLDRMLECAESDDKIGIVGPLSNTASWQSVPKIESDGDWASNDLPDDISIELMAQLIAKYSCRCYPIIPFLNGFCLLIKDALINEIGYFDENRFGEGYGEENDYCIRARKAQWKLAVADDVYIYHAQSRSYSNERRKKLCERAGKTINDKYGALEVSCGVSECRNNRVMAGIRARADVLWNRHRLLQEGKALFAGKNLLIILPVKDPSGGAYVIIQEAKSMIEMGVNVNLFNFTEHRLKFEENFSGLDIPVLYGQTNDLPFVAKDFDVVLASINNSVHWIAPLSNSGKKLAYYIQDFEPYFYPKGSNEYNLAWESYTKIPKMTNLTKTNWNRDMVEANLAVDCKVVGPSIDVDLFRPKKRLQTSNAINVGAMIRPSTPRRNPHFTLEILEEIKYRYGKRVNIITFGCSKEDLLSLKPGKDALINHIGMLNRECLPYLFNELDIFVDFSIYQAMGLTALEAMACGAAVIVPQNGGCNDFIKNGINGLLVDTGHKESCIEALTKLINNDDLRAKICLQSIFDACQFPSEMAALNMLKAIFDIKAHN